MRAAGLRAGELQQLGRHQPRDLSGHCCLERRPMSTEPRRHCASPTGRAMRPRTAKPNIAGANSRLAGTRRRSQPIVRRCSRNVPAKLKC